MGYLGPTLKVSLVSQKQSGVLFLWGQFNVVGRSGMIDQRQQEGGWGAGVIPRLSKDLRNELPEIKGFSERNLKRMIRFYREYPFLCLEVPQAVAQLPGQTRDEKVPQPVAQL